MNTFFESVDFWTSAILEKSSKMARSASHKLSLLRPTITTTIGGATSLVVAGSIWAASSANFAIPPDSSVSFNTVQFMHSSIRGMVSVSIASNRERLDSTTKTIQELAQYHEGWDGYDGVPASQTAVRDAIAFVRSLPSNVPLPWVSLGSDGEIGFLWKSEKLYADVGFSGNKRFSYYVETASGIRSEVDSVRTTDPKKVQPLVDWIVENSNDLH